MNYFFHYLGVENCIQHFSKLNLVLIDEFELDDPAMVHIMSKFFRELNPNTFCGNNFKHTSCRLR